MRQPVTAQSTAMPGIQVHHGVNLALIRARIVMASAPTQWVAMFSRVK